MRYWVFTTKPGHFKMSEALVPGETLDWPTFGRFKFEVGDIVFFYASSPVLQMIGKLEIECMDMPFSEVNPRNELRKWPRHHSNIPWMRLRVLQSAPVPFKPLQRGSLYYHTEFKPSPYPKLLHEGEREYVLRAFDEAMTYNANLARYDGGIDPTALGRVTRGDLLKDAADRLTGGRIAGIAFDKSASSLSIILEHNDDRLTLNFSNVLRAVWHYEHADDTIAGIRLMIEDTYLMLHIDGADIEVLAAELRID